MENTVKTHNRVIVAYWKNKPGAPIEVFSSLKNFCLTYPAYNYNTLNNYIGKKRIAYENLKVRIERKTILSKPELAATRQRQIAPVLRQVALKEANDDERDLAYWLTKTPNERISAVTAIVSQSLRPDQRMDKSFVSQRKLR